MKEVKVAILVADGFEPSELLEPRKALDAVGAKTVLISPMKGKVRGWKEEWTDAYPVDLELSRAKPEEFDALVLPGGVMNPDTLRQDEKAISFIKHFVQAKKTIAAICHGSWTLINAEGVKGKTMTSYPSIKIDLINAGANWVDKEVVKDGNLITSRNPHDLPAFCKTLIEALPALR